MKVKPAIVGGEMYGLEIIAENGGDEKTLKRFWDGGVKLNSYAPRSKGSSMRITFSDLIGTPFVRCATEGAVAGLKKKSGEVRDLSEKVLEGLRSR